MPENDFSQSFFDLPFQIAGIVGILLSFSPAGQSVFPLFEVLAAGILLYCFFRLRWVGGRTLMPLANLFLASIGVYVVTAGLDLLFQLSSRVYVPLWVVSLFMLVYSLHPAQKVFVWSGFPRRKRVKAGF